MKCLTIASETGKPEPLNSGLIPVLSGALRVNYPLSPSRWTVFSYTVEELDPTLAVVLGRPRLTKKI